MKNPLTPAGIEPATYRFVAQHLNHCATAVPCNGTALHNVTRPFPLLLTTVVESTMYEQVPTVF